MRLAGGLTHCGSRDLARVEEADDTVVVFATASGQTANDRAGENSPFTTALLAHLPTPGVDVELVLKNVTAAVSQATTRRQRPWRSPNRGVAPGH